MAKSKSKEEFRDTNAWMTTYTDLMILLLTFFVLLLSMSVVTEKKKLLALNSLTGAFGFKPGAHSIIGSPKGLNITMGSSPMKEEDIDFERMRNIAMRNALEANFDMIKEKQRIVIALKNRVLFQHKSSQINPGAMEYLSEIAEYLKDGTRQIEFRGYAAPSETDLEPDPLKAGVVLSTERAFGVYRFFMEKGAIPTTRMVAHGFGRSMSKSGSPRSDSELGRQVEIILNYQESIPQRMRRPKRDSLLDFNGFFFKLPEDKE